MTRPWLMASWIIVPEIDSHFCTCSSLATTTSAGINRTSENPPQTHHLPKTIIHTLLDHQEVEVAAIITIAASARPEQNHLGRRGCSLDQCPPGTLDSGLSSSANQ